MTGAFGPLPNRAFLIGMLGRANSVRFGGLGASAPPLVDAGFFPARSGSDPSEWASWASPTSPSGLKLEPEVNIVGWDSDRTAYQGGKLVDIGGQGFVIEKLRTPALGVPAWAWALSGVLGLGVAVVLWKGK